MTGYFYGRKSGIFHVVRIGECIVSLPWRSMTDFKYNGMSFHEFASLVSAFRSTYAGYDHVFWTKQ